MNLGYRFDYEFWGHGYATELAQAAIAFGFDKLACDEIFALVRPKNLASINVLAKCAFAEIGKLDDVAGDLHSLMYKLAKAGVK